MPEAPADRQGYSLHFQKSAREAQARLSPGARLELLRLFNELSEDPDRFPERVEVISKAGDLLYKHPEPPLEITYRIDHEKKIINFIDFSARALVGSLVVISYSHEDQKWRDELKKFLKPLVARQWIRIWDDTAIEAGDRWRDEIARFFGAASVAILLVSADFLASDFIMGQELPLLLQRAEKHGVRLLWIAVRPSNYELEQALEELEALNDPVRPLASLRKPAREEALVMISQKIAAFVEKPSRSQRPEAR